MYNYTTACFSFIERFRKIIKAKMKLNLSIILILIHLQLNELFSQYVHVHHKCDGHIIDTTRFFKKYPFQKYSDFKKKYIGEDLKYYIDDNKKKLSKFNNQISIDNYNQFHYNQFSVHIFAIDTVIRLDNYYEYKEIYENPIVNKLNIKDYYGNVDLAETTAIKIIDSIYI